jgi:hypothetical protein
MKLRNNEYRYIRNNYEYTGNGMGRIEIVWAFKENAKRWTGRNIVLA